jgi:hypothetical protein
MARILVNTSVSQAFWANIQDFGQTTKYIKEHDRLKAAAYAGITLARLLDEYEKSKASNNEKNEISLELLIAMLRQIRSGILNWE